MSERILAAMRVDWQQVVLNGGPPCFHLEGPTKERPLMRVRFCFRAERWEGHKDDPCEWPDHKFVSLTELLEKADLAEALAEALKECIGTLKVFHGKAGWDIYWKHSPECKRWRALLGEAFDATVT